MTIIALGTSVERADPLLVNSPTLRGNHTAERETAGRSRSVSQHTTNVEGSFTIIDHSYPVSRSRWNLQPESQDKAAGRNRSDL